MPLVDELTSHIQRRHQHVTDWMNHNWATHCTLTASEAATGTALQKCADLLLKTTLQATQLHTPLFSGSTSSGLVPAGSYMQENEAYSDPNLDAWKKMSLVLRQLNLNEESKHDATVEWLITQKQLFIDTIRAHMHETGARVHNFMGWFPRQSIVFLNLIVAAVHNDKKKTDIKEGFEWIKAKFEAAETALKG